MAWFALRAGSTTHNLVGLGSFKILKDMQVDKIPRFVVFISEAVFQSFCSVLRYGSIV
jgi:hypothetical protein